LIGSGHIDKGAIYSIAGDSKWAGSPGFEVSFRKKAELDQAFTTGDECQNIC
jgi:profilin